MIEFFVPGKAAPQGSKRHVGRGILIESSKEVGPWRERVALAAHNAMRGQPLIPRDRAVLVNLTFFMPRPASLPKRCIHMVKRPDIDKIARACLDALTDTCFEDDSQVTDLSIAKRYASELNAPGVWVGVMDLDP